MVMTEKEERELLEKLCEARPSCKECFCNDLCMFLLLKTGVATSCEDFRRRVGKVVDREKENNMLSASEAIDRTLSNINNSAIEKLVELENKINEAIENGKFYISNKGILEHEVIQRLKELGYKVTTGSQYNEPYYSISWQQ